MASYEHKKLIERIALLDNVPEDPTEFKTWIKADGHLTLLRNNAKEDELIIYGSGSGDFTFIHAVVVSENKIFPLNQDDLLSWNGNPFNPCAYYGYGGGNECVWVERNNYPWGCKALEGAQQLVFGRIFEGMEGKGGSYFEILQEYAHVTEIYWCPERHAFCRFDENGDFDHIVSITPNRDRGDVTLVSFKREPLELYLAATNSVLVCMFDFSLFRPKDIPNWSNGKKDTIVENGSLFYQKKIIDGYAGSARGVQIIRPSRPKTEIFSSFTGNSPESEDRRYVEFMAYDWRNQCIREISTDPAATANYFELSPAFFRPEVLLKYKGDRDKYTVGERNIDCRGAWRLRAYDVNEAGQVHAYICYLQNLPYQEQLYWKSYNEKPKAGISKRAIINNFIGILSDPDSIEMVLFIVSMWNESELEWWKPRDKALLERVSTPRTSSRDEWANAFMDLSKLVIEGFQVKAIRKELGRMDIAFDKYEKGIALLEKFLIECGKINDDQKLEGLRTVQHIRSTFAHSSGNNAYNLTNNALKEHGTFSAHFDSVCKTVANELRLIEEAFS